MLFPLLYDALQFLQEHYEPIHFFSVGLLCVMLLIYVSQLLVLPRTQISTNIGFVIALVIVAIVSIVSLANKITVSNSHLKACTPPSMNAWFCVSVISRVLCISILTILVLL